MAIIYRKVIKLSAINVYYPELFLNVLLNCIRNYSCSYPVEFRITDNAYRITHTA